MSNKVVISNIVLVSVSRDKKKLPEPLPCYECKNRKGRGHGKSKYFDNPSSKFWHMKTIHSKHNVDEYSRTAEKQRVDKELEALRQLSEDNQRGLL